MAYLNKAGLARLWEKIKANLDTKLSKGSKLVNENLNTIINEGFYYANASNGCANKPSGVGYFGLTVIRSGEGAGYVTQVLVAGDTGAIYKRIDKSGTWSAWQTVSQFTDTPVNGEILVASNTAGGVKTSGYTINKSVPANAAFTDTTYGRATQAADGLMAREDKIKLDKVTYAIGVDSNGMYIEEV